MYPCVVGHEIVGEAVRVGSQVKHVKVGDRVGVGAQSDSCLSRNGRCEECESGLEVREVFLHLLTGLSTSNSKTNRTSAVIVATPAPTIANSSTDQHHTAATRRTIAALATS